MVIYSGISCFGIFTVICKDWPRHDHLAYAILGFTTKKKIIFANVCG